ncbi:Chitinase A1 precursor [compost metagenome]
MGTIVDIKQVEASGYYSHAVTNSGALYGWGYNYFGTIGDGSNTDKHVPTLVANQVTKVSANSFHAMALKMDGTVWSWGLGSNGQLGNGGTTNVNLPVKLASLSSATEIAAGYMHSGAITSNGKVWSWGDGSNGQLGNGSTSSSNIPVESLFQGSIANRIVPNKSIEQVSFEDVLKLHHFVIPEHRDTLAPTIPNALLIGNQLEDSVTLVWEESKDNVAVKEYMIYMDMEPVGTTKEPQFTLSKTANDQIFTYTVRAVDASGNMSGLSNPLSVFP